MLDGEQATGAQQASSEPGDGRNHRHAVRAPEHGVWRIVVDHFGFELSAIRHVGRVGHHEIDLATQLGQQT